jgi:hypothetical protein
MVTVPGSFLKKSPKGQEALSDRFRAERAKVNAFLEKRARRRDEVLRQGRMNSILPPETAYVLNPFVRK